MERKALMALQSIFVHRFPRNNFPAKKRETSGTRNCVQHANAPRRFVTASESGCEIGICDPVNMTGLPRFLRMKLRADAV